MLRKSVYYVKTAGANLVRNPVLNLVSAITSFAGTANSVVIAEGVEREDEKQALVELGVMLQQGFYFGRPEEV